MRPIRTLLAAGAFALATVLSQAGLSPAYALPEFSTEPASGPPPDTGLTTIAAVRIGSHDGFDRVTIEFDGPIGGYDVGYVDEVYFDGSGELIELAGAQKLSIAVNTVTFPPIAPEDERLDPFFPELLQLRGAGYFEAVSSYGLGLAETTGFRVFTMTDLDVLVIDLQHPQAPAPSPEPSPSPDPAPAPPPDFSTDPATGPTPGEITEIVAVRAATHDGFDRVVFEFDGPVGGYDVRYVDEVRQDGSGNLVELAGAQKLSIAIDGMTFPPVPPQEERILGFPALLELQGAGAFEGIASYGLGLVGPTGFRVFTLADPNRLVIDLKHPEGTPPGGTAAGPGLASTGTPIQPYVAVGGILLVAGAIATYATRRRRTN